METVIKLPDVEAVQNFVKVATETDCDVLVSKEGYKYIIDGTSILGMLNVVGARIIVKCLAANTGFKNMLEQYNVQQIFLHIFRFLNNPFPPKYEAGFCLFTIKADLPVRFFILLKLRRFSAIWVEISGWR